MKSVHVHSFGDLKQFGINSLTGEACPYSMRVLCDLSEKGVELICGFLGLQIRTPATTVFGANWNSMVGNDPAVASFMMPRGLFDDLCRFAIFSVCRSDFAVNTPDGSWSGYSDCSEDVLRMMDSLVEKDGWSRYPNPNTTGAVRNVHAFTGRTE